MARGAAQPAAVARRGSATTPGFWTAAAAVLGAALLLRGLLLAGGQIPFNSDEAVVGLMARHILAGSWPTFFYGQAYMGSVDAILVAVAFRLLGASVLSIRLVQTLLFLGLILTTMLLAQRMGFPVLVSALAGTLVAVPSVNLTLYTTVSLGGYGEALLLGNLILLATLGMISRRTSPWAYFGLGALMGFALWTFGLTLIFSVPAVVVLASTELRRLPGRSILLRAAASLAGVAAGALPMLLWAATNGPRLLFDELLGSAIAGASPTGPAGAIVSHFVNLALFGPTVVLGLRAPWSASAIGMPLAPLAAVLWLALVGFGIRRSAWPDVGLMGRTLLIGVALTLAVGFVLTPFGADPSGRYFLPLAVPLAIFGAAGTAAAVDRSGRSWPVALVGFLLAFNLWTNIRAATAFPGLTTQFDASTVFHHDSDDALVDFLIARGAVAGYSTYWVSYPLAFLSGERLIYLPHLPYHPDFRYTARDDRYTPYRDTVAAEPRPSFITARQPWLDDVLRERLRSRGVQFEETAIGDYRVFHDLSAAVRPADLGLGPEAAP